jgi:hypothetical protein
MFSKKYLLTGLLLTALTLTGCGAKVDVSPDFKEDEIKKVALLPTKYPSGVRKERVDFIREALTAELKNNGINLLDDAVVQKVCSSPDCPERTTLAETYDVEGFLDINVDSASRTNFVAGYYNTISGELTLTSLEGKELFKVDHTERERGGFVFQTGQVIQGLISTIKNAGDDSFNNLAAKFVRTIATKVPLKQSLEESGSGALELAQVDVKETKPLVYEVCANASRGVIASLVISKQRTTLRETTPGRYCGLYELSTFQGSSDISLELRSAFGDVVRKDLALGNLKPCSLSKRVVIAKSGNQSQLKVLCTRVGGASSECIENLELCESSRLVVYAAPDSTGPYQKVATISKPVWPIPGKGVKKAFYEVVAVTEKGARSMPAPAVEPEAQ